MLTSIFIVPLLFKVPDNTSSPSFLKTGIDSPVIIEVSISAFPSMIIPSVGIFSPLFTSTMSFGFKLLANTIFIFLFSSIKLAFTGAKFISFFKKSLAFSFEFSSKYLPKSTKVMITEAPSKYRNLKFSGNKCGKKTTTVE